jgi:hypothetical protein
MTDPFDASPVRAPLAPLAMPRGRFTGAQGHPIWRTTYQSDRTFVELVERATIETARAYAQRRAKLRGWKVVSVGRYLGGPLATAEAPLMFQADGPPIARLARMLRLIDQENAQHVALPDARGPSDDSTLSPPSI